MMAMKSVRASMVTVLVVGGVAFAEPASQPATAPAGGAASAAQPEANSYEAIQAVAKAKQKEYLALVPTNDFLADANAGKRDAVAAQAVPLLKQVLEKLDEMADARPDYKRPILAVRLNEEAALYALSDADTIASLEAKAKAGGTDGDMATNVILRGRWLRAGKDAKLQGDVIAALDQAAAAQPKDIFLSQFIADIRPNAVDESVRQHLMDLMTTTMTNPTAKGLVAVMKNADKTLSFEGKPLVLSGKQPDGKDFSTADWKGKVVLVDFWAVWCAPCRAELPRVKKMYDQYHDKGLEVLGVDNDYDPQSVIKFTEREQLPWPQLFDADAGAKDAWNPLTTSFGINGIPVMFLIDKKGVCRTVTAREDFEKRIPELLAE